MGAAEHARIRDATGLSLADHPRGTRRRGLGRRQEHDLRAAGAQRLAEGVIDRLDEACARGRTGPHADTVLVDARGLPRHADVSDDRVRFIGRGTGRGIDARE